MPTSIANLPLVDSSGKPTSLAAHRGKVLVVSDIMTLCQETCPLDTANLVAVARAVAKAGLGQDVQFVSITIDPARDTPSRLAAYRRLFDPVPADWTLLTGSQATLSSLWNYLGVYRQRAVEGVPPAIDWLTHRPLSYDITHADLVFYFDRALHDRFVMDGPAHVARGTHLPSTLNSFLDAEGQHNLADPDGDTWTVTQALQVISWLVGRSITDTTASG
jgi:protein SCO1/2